MTKCFFFFSLIQPLTKSVVVGSHCCSKLHCYSLQTSTLTGKTEFQVQKEVLELDPNHKPKGICTIPGDGQSFLCLLGKSKEPVNLTAFPPSTNTDQYDVTLKCFTTVPSKDSVRKSDGTFNQQENNDQSSEDSPSLRLPDGSVFNGLIKVVENENASLISELKPSHGNGEISDNSKDVIKGTTVIHAMYYDFLIYLKIACSFACHLESIIFFVQNVLLFGPLNGDAFLSFTLLYIVNKLFTAFLFQRVSLVCVYCIVKGYNPIQL